MRERLIVLAIALPVMIGLVAYGYWKEDRGVSADCRLVADTLSPPGSRGAPDPATASPEELRDYEPVGLSLEQMLANAERLEDPSLRRHIQELVAASRITVQGMPPVDSQDLNPPGMKEYLGAQRQLRESIEALRTACPNFPSAR